MFKVNECRILPENKLLIVDVEIKRLPYYENVYIDKVVIDNQDTFVANGYSENPIFTFIQEDDKKYVRLEIDLKNEIEWSDENSLFFVYVTAKGKVKDETPHGLDIPITLICVCDWIRIYSKGMHYIKELNKKEIMPEGFIDFIMKYKQLELAIKSQHYQTAIQCWKEFTSELERPQYSNLPIGYGRIRN